MTFPPAGALRCDLLTFHDQFLIWATRNWVMASTSCPTLPPIVREGFGVAGAVEAADDLHQLLSIITVSAVRVIQLKPPGCRILSPDEARFLTLMTAARCETCDADTISLFRDWLPPAAARHALWPARRLAWATFEKIGSPASPHADAWRMDRHASLRSPDPGNTLTH